MQWLMMERWSPYAAGIGIGLLCCLAFLLSNQALACSTTFARTSGMIERLFGVRVYQRTYFKQFPPIVDWQWMLVLGVFVGGLLSALISGELHARWVPAAWAHAAGTSAALRWLAALVGGVIMGFGARWANGCTSGHGISGTLQLAVSSWIATICFFAGGIATAVLLFGGAR